MDKIRNYLSKNAMLVVLLLVMFFFEVMISINGKGSIFSPENLNNLIGQNGYILILATGMLLCILTGGNIDLSVGSVIVLVGGMCGILMVDIKLFGMDPTTFQCFLIVAMGMGMGAILGAWQAFWISYVKIPPFIATLAGMMAFRGLALWLMGSQNKGPLPANFKSIFNGYIPGESSVKFINRLVPGASAAGIIFWVSLIVGAIICAVIISTQVISRIQKQRKGYQVDKLTWTLLRLGIISAVVLFVFWQLGNYKGIPIALVWFGAIVLFYTYFTQSTIPGRQLYAMGGNIKAAQLSGMNTKRMMFFAYTNMGFLAGIASLVYIARFNQAGTMAGTGVELIAIAACFIGGASAYGGVGTVGGAVIGAIFMGVLNMGMMTLGWDQNLQKVINGLVLLAAIAFDVLSKRRKQSSAT